MNASECITQKSIGFHTEGETDPQLLRTVFHNLPISPNRPAMPIFHLDHFTLCTAKVDETATFFCAALGMKDGRRPNFPFLARGCMSMTVPWSKQSMSSSGT